MSFTILNDTLMNRREAVKRTGWLVGGIISAPAMLSVLQGCQAKKELSWTPDFFTKDEAAILEEVAEIILPATETPGAKDVGVPQFIDKMVANVYDEEDRANFKAGLQELDTHAQSTYGDAFMEMSPEDRTTMIKAMYEKASNAKEKKRPFILMAKELTLLGYYTSETVATTQLQYDQVPGPYKGCIPYEEVGKGYAV